jgi:hypothetical protein
VGRNRDGDAAVFCTVPLGVKVRNPLQALVGELRVGFEDAWLSDPNSFGSVRYLFGQNETESGRDDGFWRSPRCCW